MRVWLCKKWVVDSVHCGVCIGGVSGALGGVLHATPVHVFASRATPVTRKSWAKVQPSTLESHSIIHTSFSSLGSAATSQCLSIEWPMLVRSSGPYAMLHAI
jgi:hypothetical protein